MPAWSREEEAVVDRYFGSQMTEITLTQKIHEINSGRTWDAIMNKVRRCRRNGRVKKREKIIRKLRVGYLDIEATDLKGNFGFMLCWYIKPAGSRKFDSSIITKQELFDFRFDQRLVEELLQALNKYDIIYTHYGSDWRFDLPFIRTRVCEFGLQDQWPEPRMKFLLDTYPLARKKLRLHSNRLDVIAEAVGVLGVKKTPLSARTWKLAAYGHQESLTYIDRHCRHDVILLERVHKKLRPFEEIRLSSL